MTDAELSSLKMWACAHAVAGCLQARQVLDLLAAYDARGRAVLAMAERIAAQSELLSRAAARKGDQ
jgi:hypothetical protein